MRILHTTLSYGRGGRREAIGSLSDGLAALGVSSLLCCLDDFGDADQSTLKRFGATLALHRNGVLDRSARTRLAEFARKHSVDVVHSHDAASQLACTLALPWYRPPLLMTFHRSRDFESARLRDRIRNSFCSLRTAAIVVGSDARRGHYLDRNFISAKRLRRIPFGVDLARFFPADERRNELRSQLGLPADAPVLGAIGHFGPEKGIDLAIAAFQQVCHWHPALAPHLVVIGEGDSARARFLQSLVVPSLAGQVHFVGFQSEVHRWMQGLDVLLHCPRQEAFGLVLVEAMACGVPVVASAVDAIPELIADSSIGQLAPPGDTAALATALACYLVDHDKRRAAGTAAAEWVRQRFDRACYAERHLALYRELLAG